MNAATVIDTVSGFWGFLIGAAVTTVVALIIRSLVMNAVRDVLDAELRQLRERSFSAQERLDAIDHKVNAILRQINRRVE